MIAVVELTDRTSWVGIEGEILETLLTSGTMDKWWAAVRGDASDPIARITATCGQWQQLIQHDEGDPSLVALRERLARVRVRQPGLRRVLERIPPHLFHNQ
jgi:hypothetical protein